MRPVEELVNNDEPGWDLVKEWISSATNKVEILDGDSSKGADALYKLQVTTRSPLGAIVFTTGGLLIDDGWIRVLGSGHPKLTRNLPDWNKGNLSAESGRSALLLIADDAIGGFYAINGGKLGADIGKIYYLSPDNLEWEPLEIGYSEFLLFCFNGKLDEFYQGLRWRTWRDEVSKLSGDKAFTFFPTLWTKEGKDIEKSQRSAVPIGEVYSVTLSFRQQLGIK